MQSSGPNGSRRSMWRRLGYFVLSKCAAVAEDHPGRRTTKKHSCPALDGSILSVTRPSHGYFVSCVIVTSPLGSLSRAVPCAYRFTYTVSPSVAYAYPPSDDRNRSTLGGQHAHSYHSRRWCLPVEASGL